MKGLLFSSVIILITMNIVLSQTPGSLNFDQNVPNSAPNSAMNDNPPSNDEELKAAEKELLDAAPSPEKESVKAQGYYRNCHYCVCSDKRSSHGASYISYCYYCRGMSKRWLRCYYCYCSRQYNYYYSYFGFCYRCY